MSKNKHVMEIPRKDLIAWGPLGNGKFLLIGTNSVREINEKREIVETKEIGTFEGVAGKGLLLPTGDLLFVGIYRNYENTETIYGDSITIFSLKENKVIQRLKLPTPATSAILLPDGNVVLTAKDEIYIYSPSYSKKVFFPKEACLSPYLNNF